MLAIIVFIVGLVVGSFLNVCIYRMPKKESIVRPRSHCPYCNKTIPWYDNIPLLSFIILGGKCRFCKVRISPLYFGVELLTGFTFTALLNHFGLGPVFVIYAALISSLIVCTFVDFKILEIPDEITLSGIMLGFILSFSFPQLMGKDMRSAALFQSFLGFLVGGGSIYIMGLIGMFLFKKEAMGGGDVKLLAMIGAFIGWKLALLVFFISPFFGSIIGIFLKIKQKKEMMPYGPYISLGAAVAIFWGDRILEYIFLM